MLWYLLTLMIGVLLGSQACKYETLTYRNWQKKLEKAYYNLFENIETLRKKGILSNEICEEIYKED